MSDAWELLTSARVAVLGTIGPGGRTHQVPVTFAVDEGRLVTMIDWKPKSGRRLQRLSNIEADPSVSLLAHHYEDDWTRLWWVRVVGEARVVSDGPEWESARTALAAKYFQYARNAPEGEAIVITPTRLRSWSG